MNRVPTIFAHPWMLSLLLVMPLLTLVQMYASWRMRRVLLRLGQPISLIGILPPRPRWRWIPGLLFSMAMSTLIAGAASPRWGLESNPQVVAGRDLMLVLDMSNSMRATDALPSRFQHSVAALRNLIDYLRTRGGHRVGLVVFAGDAQVVCPLTHDYGHVASKLAELDLDHPPVGLVPRSGLRSGTRLSVALQLAVAAHDPSFRGYQDVLLISDGHDPLGHDDWQAGLSAVESAGIPIYTVGIGDPTVGGLIDVPGRDTKVPTRLQEYPLQEMARRTGGSYHRARLDDPRLDEFFRRRIEPKGTTVPPGDSPPLPRSRQVWFYAAALGLFALSAITQMRWSDLVWLRQRLPRRRKPMVREPVVVSSGRRVAVASLVLLTLLAAAPPAADQWQRQGDAAFDAGRFDEAASYYSLAEERTDEPGRVAFNLAIVQFNLGRYREAERLFRCSLESGGRRASSLYGLGTCLLHSSRGRDGDRLAEAINVLGRCLDVAEPESERWHSARHNLELAKLLWRAVHSDAPPPEKDSDLRDNTSPRDDESPDRPPGQAGDEQGSQMGNGRPQPVANAASDGPRPIPTHRDPGPGQGPMSPLTEEEQASPLTPHEAREQLRRAGERIARERRALLRPVGEARDYPDW